MKQLAFFLLVCLISLMGFSQPTFDFEGWNGTGVNENPNGWVTGNLLVNILLQGNQQSVFKVNGADAHSGTYAMKIVTVPVVTNPLPSILPNPIGIAATGKSSGLDFKMGFPFTGMPETMEFYYKYAPISAGDTASAYILFTKWNVNKKDTIGGGLLNLSSAVNSYTAASVTMHYISTTTPDSAIILFSATTNRCLTCGKAGSTLYIDDVAFKGNVTGIKDNELAKYHIKLYPNPAKDFISVKVSDPNAYKVNIYDLSGKQLDSYLLNGANTTVTSKTDEKAQVITTLRYNSGLYFYSIVDSNNFSLYRGKFTIVK